MGSGCALFDFDNDGRLDIYLIHNGGPGGARNQLFHQQPDGTFVDVSAGSGLDVAGYGMGVAIGDVNNDGLPDVLLTEFGRIRLFLNEGGGHFRDVTTAAGLADDLWATSAAFVDYDRDGNLDLVVTHYVGYDPKHPCADAAGLPEYCGPRDFEGTVTKLFHNRGAGPGTGGVPIFEDVTAAAGLAGMPARGLGVICADFDGDGWPDILVANDGQPNHLWINRHDGTFRDEATQRGVAYDAMGRSLGNMGVAIGDVSGDGLFGLYITHLSEESNTLWTQGPRGQFTDTTAAMGLTSRATGFGTVLADFDNDGWPDLAVVNGRVVRGPTEIDPARASQGIAAFWRPYAECNRLYRNRGDGQFVNVSSAAPALCAQANVARGLACGDVLNDGGIDLLVTTIGGRARLLRNTARRGHWLTVRAVDPALGGRDAYGARIILDIPGRTLVGWANPASSYLCSNDPRVHFGLGPGTQVKALHVQWPDGVEQAFDAPAGVDRVITIARRPSTR